MAITYSINIDVYDIMILMKRSYSTASRRLKKIRASLRKTIDQILTVLEYATYNNITEAEVLRALGRIK